MDITYKNEKTLFTIAAILAGLFWLTLTLATFGILLIYLLIGYLFYLFIHSAFISYLKGTGVKITPEQYPDLHQKLNAACQKVELATVPDAYILRTDMFNALATKFLNRHFIVLFSDVVDALEGAPDAIDFYIGHELGHIHRKHLKWGLFLAPALITPWLGAAYRRAQEYTCDRYGAHCTNNEDNIVKALSVIAAGNSRARTFNATAYIRQIEETSGFWMSINELTSDYPWLTKRMASAIAFKRGDIIKHPPRHRFAWVLSLFVPRIGFTGGAMAGLIMLVAIIGILAALAIPAYQDYINRAQNFQGFATEAKPLVQDASIDTQAAYDFALSVHPEFETYYAEYLEWPTSFKDLGYGSSTLYLENGMEMDIYENGKIGVWMGNYSSDESLLLITEAYADGNNHINWMCYVQGYDGSVPEECRSN